VVRLNVLGAAVKQIFIYITMGLLLPACVGVIQPVSETAPHMQEDSTQQLEKEQLHQEGLSQEKVLGLVEKPRLERISIAAVGDVFMAGTSAPTLQKNGYDYPFDKTKYLFEQADVVVANLESPLTSRGTAFIHKKYVFRAPAEQVAPSLAKAGFNLVTLANNHTMDYGAVGLRDTKIALDQYSIAYMGAGKDLETARKPYIFEKQGFKVGFLAYSLTYPEDFWANSKRAGTAFGYEHHIRQDIQKLVKEVDSVVVSFHWGREGTTKLRAYQTRLGRVAIDEGASLVIGHHPHIMQGLERYKNGLILYSLGNYVFGSYSNRVQYGGIANITLNKQGFESLALTMVDVNNFRRHFQPIPLQGYALKQAFDELQQLSKKLNTPVQLQGDKLMIQKASQP